MPKRAKEISARQVTSIKDDGRYTVGGLPGLYLHVRGISRSWLLRVKVGGRRRDLGLGSLPEVTLTVARDRAWEKRKSAPSRSTAVVELQATPKDPPSAASTTTPNVSRETTTFESCARTYVAAQAPGWKSRKHAKQWLSTLEAHAFPVVGKLDVAVVAVTHVRRYCNRSGRQRPRRPPASEGAWKASWTGPSTANTAAVRTLPVGTAI